MQQDEIYAQIAEIDYSLRTQNTSIIQRIYKVKKQLFPDINDLVNRISTLNSEESGRLISTLQVDDWYRENYGYKQTPDYLSIKETPFFMQGEIWYFTHPEKTEYCNIIDCTNFPEIVKQKLTEGEIEYLKDSFKCSRQKLQAIKYLDDVVLYRNQERKNDPDVPFVIPDELKNNFYFDNETIKFIRFAIEDLNLAIVTLKNTRDYQFIIFPASQAIEKLLKACIISEYKMLEKEVSEILETLRSSKYGHKLLKIIKDFNKVFAFPEKIKLEIDKFPNAKKIFKESVINPRYHVIKVSSKQAVEVIDATLNIFELVSEKFCTPLKRVMYFPDLEEGYDEYHTQLEDDDCFFEE